eukprot:3025298-Pyramimonas_sp.AAC.1
MGDLCGTAPGVAGSDFVLDLGRDIKVKWPGLQGDGADCELLKGRRVREADATYIQSNEKYFAKALETLGLEEGNPRATPGVEARRTGRDDTPDLSPDE